MLMKHSRCDLLQWFLLEEVPYGEVHLKLQWLSLNTDPSLLTEVNLFLFKIKCPRHTQRNLVPLASNSSTLYVYLHSKVIYIERVELFLR